MDKSTENVKGENDAWKHPYIYFFLHKDVLSFILKGSLHLRGETNKREMTTVRLLFEKRNS